MLETNHKKVVLGDYNLRFDVPKSEIYEMERNVILNLDWDGLMKYKVNKYAPLQTGEPISAIHKETIKQKESEMDPQGNNINIQTAAFLI